MNTFNVNDLLNDLSIPETEAPKAPAEGNSQPATVATFSYGQSAASADDFVFQTTSTPQLQYQQFKARPQPRAEQRPQRSKLAAAGAPAWQSVANKVSTAKPAASPNKDTKIKKYKKSNAICVIAFAAFLVALVIFCLSTWVCSDHTSGDGWEYQDGILYVDDTDELDEVPLRYRSCATEVYFYYGYTLDLGKLALNAQLNYVEIPGSVTHIYVGCFAKKCTIAIDNFAVGMYGIDFEGNVRHLDKVTWNTTYDNLFIYGDISSCLHEYSARNGVYYLN